MVVDNFLQLNIITEIAQEVAFDKLKKKDQDDRTTNQSSNEKHILHIKRMYNFRISTRGFNHQLSKIFDQNRTQKSKDQLGQMFRK